MKETFPRKSSASLTWVGLVVLGWLGGIHAQETTNEAEVPAAQPMYIQEYRVIGATKLDRRSVERAVYPFLGPGRLPGDVDQARAALEKAYFDQGYETVQVTIPDQKMKQGIIFLQVTERPVGRLRVHGARYFALDGIKKRMPSVTEGSVPNFKEVNRELLGLTHRADLRVEPVLKPGAIPGTVDIDLNVQDTLPLHGNLEVNNRYSANTTPWRLNGGLSYGNLWQLGHTFGFSFQIAPQRLEDAAIYSAYYTVPFPGYEQLSLTLQATNQDSDVSTLGGGSVAGRGKVAGVRVKLDLPVKRALAHSLTFGMDYKKFDEDLTTAGVTTPQPITYYPLSLNYNATWSTKKRTTALNAGVNFGIRGMADDAAQFNNKRYNADEGFMFFRGDLSHLEKLPGDFGFFIKGQGQISSGPLINNEQISGGGLGTVRGYLESTALGDNGIFGNVELRSPSLLKNSVEGENEWRFYLFADGGQLTLNDPLPGQQADINLASVGVGSSFRLFNHLNGSVDAGVPLIAQSVTRAGELLFTIRFWADF